jgi:hypothetical protein
MWIRLTVDDGLTVQAIEVLTEKSPYHACGSITPNFQRLIGLKIGPGWTRSVKERLGGVQGCTHLVELLGPIATTAFQTVFPILSREINEKAKGQPGEGSAKRPVLLNTCHMFASDGEIARKRWPEHYTGNARVAAGE